MEGEDNRQINGTGDMHISTEGNGRKGEKNVSLEDKGEKPVEKLEDKATDKTENQESKEKIKGLELSKGFSQWSVSWP